MTKISIISLLRGRRPAAEGGRKLRVLSDRPNWRIAQMSFLWFPCGVSNMRGYQPARNHFPSATRKHAIQSHSVDIVSNPYTNESSHGGNLSSTPEPRTPASTSHGGNSSYAPEPRPPPASPDPKCALLVDRLPSGLWTLNLPVFHNLNELRRSFWHQYILQVYGPKVDFPLDMRCFTFFWRDLLPAKAVTLLRPHLFNGPAGPNADPRNGHILESGRGWMVYMYMHHDLTWPELQRSDLDQDLPPWSLGPFRASAFESNSRVEVYHAWDDCTHSGQSKPVGYWGHYAPGSGVFANLGRTVHAGGNGYYDFCKVLLSPEQCKGCCTALHIKETAAATARGFGSLQSCCGKRGGDKYKKQFEIQFFGSPCTNASHEPLMNGCPAGLLSSGRFKPMPCTCDTAVLPTTRCKHS